MKVVICSCVLTWRMATGPPSSARLWCGLWHTAAFASPAGVYLVMNIFSVYAAALIAPPMFQLLANMKIMTTAVVGSLLLARSLAASQWAAVTLLTFGTLLGQWSGQQGTLEGHASMFEFLLMLFNSTLSAIASVLTERLLKGRGSEQLSIFATNFHMAVHTILLNGIALLLVGALGWGWAQWPSPFHLRGCVLLALTNEALNGILLSSIMRSADSNVKNYAFGVSVFSVVGFSALIFGYFPRPGFFVGAAVVLVSMVLYTHGAAAKKS